MEVVINKCYGGFGLSDKAVERAVELGMKITEYGGNGYKDENAQFVRTDDRPTTFGKYFSINSSDLEFRSDPRLVQVVKELGDEANGRFAELKVVEIPDNIEWEIGEYDGTEWIDEKHRSWG